MSRWQLLKQALTGSERADKKLSSLSIHRHDGFHILPRKRIYWGWTKDCVKKDSLSLHSFLNQCREDCVAFDCAEVQYSLYGAGSTITKIFHIINKGQSEGWLRLNRIRISPASYKNKSKIFHYIMIDISIVDPTFTATSCKNEFWEYHIPTTGVQLNSSNSDSTSPTQLSGCCIYTREAARESGVRVSSLFSHVTHGVDNTGMVRVWVAEQVLLHILLTSLRGEVDLVGKRVLEIGGGMTGLCGLGLAALGECSDVVITDGNPDCIGNQKICIAMCEQKNVFQCPVRSHRLRWLKEDPLDELSLVMSSKAGRDERDELDRDNAPLTAFDVIIAADCLFFRDFHKDLLWVLETAVAPNGVVVLLQPQRGGSMNQFIKIAENSFFIQIVENYSPEVWALHQQYLIANAGSTSYEPDIHYPILVIMRKK